MTIKEVSERFGVSTDTLRYYERIGLIPPVARTAGVYAIIPNQISAGWSTLYVCAMPEFRLRRL